MISIDTVKISPAIEGFLPKSTERDSLLREMADHLASEGRVKEEYGEAVISRENVYPTGIPAEPIAVAIPHSDRDYVLDTTILVAKLPQPVVFRRIDDGDLTVEVHVVFMLAVNSNQGQLDTIARIMELIQDAELIKKITEAGTAEEIGKLVSAAYHIQ